MAYEIGTATNNYDLVVKLRTFLESQLPLAERWTAVRADMLGGPLNANGEHEVIWQAPGLSGTEQIFVGLRTYKSVASDIYNLYVKGFTGYVPGNTFDTQPGASGSFGVPLWNQVIQYWFVANGQRCIVFVRTENTVDSFYLGKIFPYSAPGQYPYPLFVGGMLTSASLTNPSDTSRVSWWKGNRSNASLRFVDGSWRSPRILPYFNSQSVRNTGSSENSADGYYYLQPLQLYETGSVYGELDGVFFVSGYNNAHGNTLVVNGVTYVVMRDVTRTGMSDYIALRLQ